MAKKCRENQKLDFFIYIQKKKNKVHLENAKNQTHNQGQLKIADSESAHKVGLCDIEMHLGNHAKSSKYIHLSS